MACTILPICSLLVPYFKVQGSTVRQKRRFPSSSQPPQYPSTRNEIYHSVLRFAAVRRSQKTSLLLHPQLHPDRHMYMRLPSRVVKDRRETNCFHRRLKLSLVPSIARGRADRNGSGTAFCSPHLLARAQCAMTSRSGTHHHRDQSLPLFLDRGGACEEH